MASIERAYLSRKTLLTSSNVFLFFITLLFLSEFITKILFVYCKGDYYRLAGVVKLAFQLTMFGFLVYKFKYQKIYTLLLILSVTFIISNFFLNSQFTKSQTLENIYYFDRYIYILIFIAFFKANVQINALKRSIQIFKFFLYLNTIPLLFGLLFKIELFKSYVFTERFGYSGMFAKHGDTVYYYLVFISILYYEYTKQSSLKNLIKLLLIILISLLVGKKAILLYLVLLFILHFAIIKKQVKFILSMLVLGASLIFILKDYILSISPFWKRIVDTSGLIGAITSNRSELLVNFITFITNKWNTFNYIFGYGEYETVKVEFEFVDVFLFFGVVGLLSFFIILKNNFYVRNNSVVACVFFSIVITSFFSGAFFLSVTGMIYFYLMMQYFKNDKLIH